MDLQRQLYTKQELKVRWACVAFKLKNSGNFDYVSNVAAGQQELVIKDVCVCVCVCRTNKYEINPRKNTEQLGFNRLLTLCFLIKGSNVNHQLSDRKHRW